MGAHKVKTGTPKPPPGGSSDMRQKVTSFAPKVSLKASKDASKVSDKPTVTTRTPHPPPEGSINLQLKVSTETAPGQPRAGWLLASQPRPRMSTGPRVLRPALGAACTDHSQPQGCPSPRTRQSTIRDLWKPVWTRVQHSTKDNTVTESETPVTPASHQYDPGQRGPPPRDIC